MTKEEFEQLRKDINELRTELLMVVGIMRDLSDSLQKSLGCMNNYSEESMTAKNEEFFKQNVEDFLISLGIPRHKKGFTYLKTAVEIGRKEGITRGRFYSKVSQETGASFTSLESCIRMVHKDAAEKNTETFISVFGKNYTMMSTTQFIATIVDFLKSQ